MAQVIPLSAEAEARAMPAGKISYEEFLEWYDEFHAEWVDGKVIMGQPPTFERQADSDFLMRLLGMYIEARDLGVLVSAPFQMRLRAQKSGREPDLMFIAKENVGRIARTFLDGPADLVIETISPQSVARDRTQKFAEYQAAGIREYWLIDPPRKQAEFYVLGTTIAIKRFLLANRELFALLCLKDFLCRSNGCGKNHCQKYCQS